MSLTRHLQRFRDVEWNWLALSLNGSLSLNTLKTFPDKPWNWHIVTRNPKFVWLWVQHIPDAPWDWKYISEMENFTWDWVREFPKKPWDWGVLSKKIRSINTIKEFPDAPWDWYELTLSPKTNISEMVENSNFPWKINELLFHDVDEETIRFLRFYRSHYDKDAWKDHTSRTPWRLIKQNYDLPWDLYHMKLNSSDEFLDEDMKYLYEYNGDLNWYYLSAKIDFKIMMNHMDAPWDFQNASVNKTVSYKHMIQFPELDWCHSVVQLEDEKREWNAANIIKRYWKRSVTDPGRALCRKLLLKDLSIIGDDISNNQSRHEVQ